MFPLRRSTIVLATSTLAWLAPLAAHAQGVSINGTGAAADTSAILDLSSTSKGLLLPRLTAVQRGAMVLPATGLVVYQTDGTPGLYWNAGSPVAPDWRRVAEGGGGGTGQWSVNGSNLYYAAGKVSVGTTATDARLTVVDSLNALRVQTNTSGGTLASFGGLGNFRVDAPGTIAGRLSLLENGYLGIGRTSPVARLDLAGGNWDVVNGEGDLRIGNDSYRLKIGMAVDGGGAGGVSLMQQGVTGGYNVLTLGAQAHNVLFVNGNTQRVGIGTDVPTAGLGFAAALGKKITLYPGTSGDYGFGISSGRLQIATEATGGNDVAVGYDAAGTFTERFAFKNTGALAVNTNTGTAGQVLQSNGASSPVTWVSPTNTLYNGTTQVTSTGSVTLNTNSPWTQVPGLTQTVSIGGTSKVLISFAVPIAVSSCFACGGSNTYLDVQVDGNTQVRYPLTLGNGASWMASGTWLASVGAGSHTFRILASVVGQDTGVGLVGTLAGNLIIQVIPQ